MALRQNFAMQDEKTPYEEIHDAVECDAPRNSDIDTADMYRLGKIQEFKRNFNLLSTLGFISIFMATWEYTFVSLAVGLPNGGFAGLFWTFIVTVILYSSVVVSLAEMASMAPTAGGQYHWVSEFAPQRYQRFLSYASGWMSTLGWLASLASSIFVCVTLLQSLIAVSDTSFVFTNWQYTLIMLATLAVTIVFNTWGGSFLPLLEILSFFGHILGLLIIIIPVWVMAPKNSAAAVFTDFSSQSGWSLGPAFLVTQVAVLYCNLGSDSIVHIAEEVTNASVTVPQVMWWSYLLNVVLAIVALLTMLFCIGPLDTAIAAEAPYLQLFANTNSAAVSYLLLLVLFILIFSGNITALTTTAREVFAFSRDTGFPMSRWLSRMNKKRRIPFNAVYVTSVAAGVICLINLGSSVAFNVVISLNLLALMSTYMLSIGCVTLKRLRGEELPHARWSLGRWGLPINIFAFFYCGFVVVCSCLPSYVPVDAGNANWAPAVWGAVGLGSVITYLVHGRRRYTAPVTFVVGNRTGGFQDIELR